MLHGSCFSSDAVYGVPVMTELYQTANRSCPSGFVLGFSTTSVLRRAASVISM